VRVLNDVMRALHRFLRFLSNSLRPCLLLLGLLPSAFGSVARNDIEVVEVAGGVVQVDDRGATPVSEVGAKIRRKAKVIIPGDGRLIFALSNGARVLVDGNSSFQVQAFVDSPGKGSLVDIRPDFGRFTFALPRQGPGDVFVVRDAQGEQHLKSRGLYQLVAAQGAPAPRFICLAGETLFTPAQGLGQPVRLKTGEQMVARAESLGLTTSAEPMGEAARRRIVEGLAYEREFKVYPLELDPAARLSATSATTLEAVMASIEEIVERQTQINPSPTGG
jgi:hypothetical protein